MTQHDWIVTLCNPACRTCWLMMAVHVGGLLTVKLKHCRNFPSSGLCNTLQPKTKCHVMVFSSACVHIAASLTSSSQFAPVKSPYLHACWGDVLFKTALVWGVNWVSDSTDLRRHHFLHSIRNGGSCMWRRMTLHVWKQSGFSLTTVTWDNLWNLENPFKRCKVTYWYRGCVIQVLA